jgi:hypothetical protein
LDFNYLISEEVRQRIGQIILTTVTVSNHGRNIPWPVEQLNQQAVTGDLDTIMAVLACGEPNSIAGNILRDFP